MAPVVAVGEPGEALFKMGGGALMVPQEEQAPEAVMADAA